MKHQSSGRHGNPIQQAPGLRERPFSAVKRAFAIFLVLCPVGGVCVARNIYVHAESQARVTDGSKALPFKTITEALKIVEGGDTVIVRKGIYRESVRVPGGADSTGAARMAPPLSWSRANFLKGRNTIRSPSTRGTSVER